MKLIDILRNSQLSELPEKLKNMNVELKGGLAKAYAAALDIAYNIENKDKSNEEQEAVALESNVVNAALFTKLQDRLAEAPEAERAIIYALDEGDLNSDTYESLVNDMQNSKGAPEVIMIVNNDVMDAANTDNVKQMYLKGMESYVNTIGGTVISTKSGRLFK
jgi:hypothetical protein